MKRAAMNQATLHLARKRFLPSGAVSGTEFLDAMSLLVGASFKLTMMRPCPGVM
jgi:hypothetical protein